MVVALSPVMPTPDGGQVIRLKGGWVAVHLPGEEGTFLAQYSNVLALETGVVIDLFQPNIVIPAGTTVVCRGLYLHDDGRVETGEYGLVVSGSVPGGQDLLPPAVNSFHRMTQAYARVRRGGV